MNKAPTRLSYDIFDVKQYQGESMKNCLNRFGVQVVRLEPTDEAMIVHAFLKRMLGVNFTRQMATTYVIVWPWHIN